MNTLPRGADFDGRLQTVRRQIVKVNAVIDEDAYNMSRQRIRNRPDDVLYKGEGLTGTLTNDHWKLFELEPAGVINQRALFGDSQRFPAGNGMRGARGQETRVPVYSVANGLRGETPAEIDAQITLMGFTDQTGRESNKSYCNLIIGGLITPCNSGPETIMTGDIVMARTPTLEEARNIRARSGDLANTKGRTGRIPFILCPFRPDKYDFFSYPVRIKTLDRLFEVDKGKIKKKETTKKSGAYMSLDYVTQRFCVAYESLVDATAAMYMTMAGAGADKDEALHRAVLLLVAAGRSPYAASLDTALEKDIVKIPGAISVVDTNPFQTMLAAIFRFGMDVSSKILGRAVLSAPPGKDFDLMVGHYQR